MAKIQASKLLGFEDFYPNSSADSKLRYATSVGKKGIRDFCCYLLSFAKFNATPDVATFLTHWFTFTTSSYQESAEYHGLKSRYDSIVNHNPQQHLSIISEEALLNLYIWTHTEESLPDQSLLSEHEIMSNLMKLLLLFNTMVLINYQTAVDSVQHLEMNKAQAWMLATSFPQNDISNIDYAQLMYTQMYKSLKLLEFLEETMEYNQIFKVLLKDFDSSDKTEFIRALAGATFIPFRNDKPGWTTLTVTEASDPKRAGDFLQKISFDSDNVQNDQNDFKILRDRPFEVTKEGFRLVFDLFLLKKLYNGLIFKLSEYSTKDRNVFTDFLGRIRNDFSEGVLVYQTLNHVFASTKARLITGNEFKAAGLEREPDYYCRVDDRILLFESKDFFVPGAVKLSYDFNKIESELKKDGRLGKAVKQLAKNIQRTFEKELILDEDYDSKTVSILPIVIVHDALYSTPSLNFWVNEWMIEEFARIEAEAKQTIFDSTRILPVTLIEIDSLILYSADFNNNTLPLIEIIEQFHNNVNLPRKKGDKILDLQQCISFSEFVRSYGFQSEIELNTSLVNALFRKFGL